MFGGDTHPYKLTAAWLCQAPQIATKCSQPVQHQTPIMGDKLIIMFDTLQVHHFGHWPAKELELPAWAIQGESV